MCIIRLVGLLLIIVGLLHVLISPISGILFIAVGWLMLRAGGSQ